MKVTIEMSLYPLQEDYKEAIIAFIQSLKSEDDINVYTTAMSTYVVGEYVQVMHLLTDKLKSVFDTIPASCTVIKIIPKDLNVEQGFFKFLV